MKNKKLLGLMLAFAFVLSLSSFVTYLDPARAADPPVPLGHEMAQFNIVVLPDGRIAVSQSTLNTWDTSWDDFYIYSVSNDTIVYNYTNPQNYTTFSSNVTYMTMSFDVENNVGELSFDYDTEMFPPGSLPNVTTDPILDANLGATYSNGVFTITASADADNFNMTEMFPSPFLIPGFSVSFSMSNGIITGQIIMEPDTFVSSQVTIDLSGNRTHITLSGSGGLNYMGDTFNWTHLEFMKSLFQNLTGPQSQNGTLLNITQGMLEATQASFTYVNHSGAPPTGANVDFDLVVANTTTGILQSFLPWMLNDTIGDENVTAAIFYSIEKALNETSGSMSIGYDADDLTMGITASFTLDIEDVIEFMKEPIEASFPSPPWDVPPLLNSDIPELMEFFFMVNATDAAWDHFDSMSWSMNMDMAANAINSTASATFNNVDTILEDINDALNVTVDFWWWNENVSIVDLHFEIVESPTEYHRYQVETYDGGSQAIVDYLQDHGDVDLWVWDYLDDFWGHFNDTWYENVTCSFSNYYREYGYIEGQGNYRMLSGVILDIDPVFNDTWYDLDDFFNNWILNSGPGVNETSSITVSGGSNGTHHTILSTDSVAAPPDDNATDPDGNLLIAHWDNETVDNLAGLLFRPYEGGFSGHYIDKNVVNEYNPFIMYDPYLGVRLEITNVSDSTALTVGVATDPTAPGGGLTPVGFYVNITTEVDLTYLEGWITFYYTDPMVESLGLNEETLEVYWYNPATSSYEALSPVIRNTDENWVSGYLDHLSVFVLLGLPAGLPLWLILTIVGVVVVAALGVGFVLLRRRSVPTEGKVKKDTEGWKET